MYLSPNVTKRFPPEMAGYFSASWNTEDLWRLDLPVEQADLGSLLWHLELPFWSSRPPEPLFDLAPRSVLEAPRTYPGHSRRLREADTAFPLDAAVFGSRLVILDGLHRLAHLVLQGERTVRYRVVPSQVLFQGLRPSDR